MCLGRETEPRMGGKVSRKNQFIFPKKSEITLELFRHIIATVNCSLELHERDIKCEVYVSEGETGRQKCSYGCLKSFWLSINNFIISSQVAFEWMMLGDIWEAEELPWVIMNKTRKNLRGKLYLDVNMLNTFSSDGRFEIEFVRQTFRLSEENLTTFFELEESVTRNLHRNFLKDLLGRFSIIYAF